MANFRDYVARLLPSSFSGELGAGWFGVLCGLTGDLIAQGITDAVRAPWLKDPKSPDDVLPFIGNERGMIRYPGESVTSWRSRLIKTWDAYEFAGAAESIETQLAAYGYPGKVTFFPGRDGPFGEPAPYWSQFWITFASGTHPVTSEGPPWDTFNWDDGSVWGPVGYTPEFAATLHAIVNKWKPVDWICRGFIFEFGTATWDTFNWDDGTLWDGAVEVNF
jgi:hypothetical protein